MCQCVITSQGSSPRTVGSKTTGAGELVLGSVSWCLWAQEEADNYLYHLSADITDSLHLSYTRSSGETAPLACYEIYIKMWCLSVCQFRWILSGLVPLLLRVLPFSSRPCRICIFLLRDSLQNVCENVSRLYKAKCNHSFSTFCQPQRCNLEREQVLKF